MPNPETTSSESSEDSEILEALVPRTHSSTLGGSKKRERSTEGETSEKKHIKRFDSFMKDELFKAAFNGDIEKMKDLLEQGGNINAKDKENYTLLHKAIASKKVEAVALVLEKDVNKINLSVSNKTGCKPFHEAVLHQGGDSKREIVKLLIDCEAKFDASIHETAYEGSLDEIGKLCEKSFKVLNETDQVGYRALHYAVANNQIKLVSWLIEKGVNIETGEFYEKRKSWSLGKTKSQSERKTQRVSSLFLAVKNNHQEMVESLLSHGADIEALNSSGSTPLMVAAAYGHLDIVKLLLSKGAKTDKRNEYGNTALLRAAERGRVNVVRYLIDENFCDLNEENDKNKYTALARATEGNYIEVVKLLLRRKNLDVNKKTLYGNAALHLAALYGYLEIAKILCQDSQTSVNEENEVGETALMIAVTRDHIKIAKILYSRGANLNKINKKGETLDLMAKRTNDPELIQWLCEKLMLNFVEQNQLVALIKLHTEDKVSLNCKGRNGNTPLLLAAQLGHEDIVSYLVKNKADHQLKNNEGNCPLHMAACGGHASMVQTLLDIGCFVDKRNKNSQTPLHLAAMYGKQNVLEVLLKNGAVIDACDKDGRIILHWASIGGHIGIVEYLFDEQNLNPNLQDEQHNTPLHLAIEFEKINVVKKLLKSESDLDIANKQGLRPIDVAAVKGNVEVLELFIDDNLDIISARNDGKTALHHAASSGHLDVVKFLVSHGADIEKEDEEGKSSLALAQEKGYEHVVGYLRTELARQQRPILRRSASRLMPKIRALVFQGGSVKGIAYVGALRELENYDVKLGEIRYIGGTSAGAITAALLGVGYTPNELETMLGEMTFTDFLDGSEKHNLLDIKKALEKHGKKYGLSLNLIFQELIRRPEATRDILTTLQSRYGLFRGEWFRLWIEKKIADKIDKISYLTFKELHQKSKNNPNLKDIYFVGTNVVTKKSEIFSNEHTPDMIISDAVRISMSIPFLFEPHCYHYKKNGERVADKSKWYVDGGVLDNYPIWLFDNTKYLAGASDEAPGAPTINYETLGFRLVPLHLQKFYEDHINMFNDTSTIAGLMEFGFAVASCYMKKQESDHKNNPADIQRTIHIENKNISMLAFDLNDEQKRSLVEAGERAVRNHFKKLKQAYEVNVTPTLISIFVNNLQDCSITYDESGTLSVRNMSMKKSDPEFVYECFAQCKTVEDMDFLRRMHILVNANDKSGGNTPAHVAASRGDKTVLKKFIGANASLIKARNLKNESLLDAALSCSDRKKCNPIVRYLIKKGLHYCNNVEKVKEICQTHLDGNEDHELQNKLKSFIQSHERIKENLKAKQYDASTWPRGSSPRSVPLVRKSIALSPPSSPIEKSESPAKLTAVQRGNLHRQLSASQEKDDDSFEKDIAAATEASLKQAKEGEVKVSNEQKILDFES